MIDEKQQSQLIRPKVVPPPMFTPSSNSTAAAATRPHPHPALIEMSSQLRKHDPDAARLHDCIFQVKIFAYNSVELRWENAATIEGNLCAYERQQLINGVAYPSFAFAVLSGEKYLIQSVSTDMVHHADKLRLFYEVSKNARREVFCVHFLSEGECQRLHSFLTRSIQTMQKFAETVTRPAVPDLQAWIPNPMNGQTPTNLVRQQQQQPQQPLPTMMKSVARTPTRLQPNYPIELSSTPAAAPVLESSPFPPSPITMNNGTNNAEDPTLSLKRLLNIRSQTALENLSLEDPPLVMNKLSNPIDLMPPSAFEPISGTAQSPVTAIGAERLKSQSRPSNPPVPPMNREHFRQVLLHLIESDDHFFEMIYQACLTHPPSTTQ